MANKEGMVVQDVTIENAVIEVNLDLDNDEVAIGGVKSDGSRILYKAIDDGTGKGIFPVTMIGGTPPAPGTIIGPTPADTVVGIGATVPLPAIPAGTRRVTIQNKGPAGSFILIRELGGVPGAGPVLARLASITLGTQDGALAAVEVEDVSLAFGGLAVPSSVTMLFERP